MLVKNFILTPHFNKKVLEDSRGHWFCPEDDKRIALKCISIILFFLITSCTKSNQNEFAKTQIHFLNFKRIQLKKQESLQLQLIDYYPAPICANGVSYANLYICRSEPANDTLFVFDICQDVNPYAKDFTEFSLLPEDVKEHVPDSVSVILPKYFYMPKSAKYICGSITFLED